MNYAVDVVFRADVYLSLANILLKTCFPLFTMDSTKLTMDCKTFTMESTELTMDGKTFTMESTELTMDCKTFTMDDKELTYMSKKLNYMSKRLTMDCKTFTMGSEKFIPLCPGLTLHCKKPATQFQFSGCCSLSMARYSGSISLRALIAFLSPSAAFFFIC